MSPQRRLKNKSMSNSAENKIAVRMIKGWSEIWQKDEVIEKREMTCAWVQWVAYLHIYIFMKICFLKNKVLARCVYFWMVRSEHL